MVGPLPEAFGSKDLMWASDAREGGRMVSAGYIIGNSRKHLYSDVGAFRPCAANDPLTEDELMRTEGKDGG